MIGTAVSQRLLEYMFTDGGSPWTGWVEVSLHTQLTGIGTENELALTSYSRALVGMGSQYWAVGARSVTNRTEIIWPALVAGEMPPPVRSIALWAQNGDLIWDVPLDEGAIQMVAGNRPVCPAGGLVLSLG